MGKKVTSIDKDTKVTITIEIAIYILFTVLVAVCTFLYHKTDLIKDEISQIKTTTARIDERLKNNEKKLEEQKKIDQDLKRILNLLEKRESSNSSNNGN